MTGMHQIRQPSCCVWNNCENPFLAPLSHSILGKTSGQVRCGTHFCSTAVGHTLSKSLRNPWLSFPGAISSMFQRKSSYMLLANWHWAEEQMVWPFRKMEIDRLRRVRPFRFIYLMRNKAQSWHCLFLRWQRQVWRWAGEMRWHLVLRSPLQQACMMLASCPAKISTFGRFSYPSRKLGEPGQCWQKGEKSSDRYLSKDYPLTGFC